MSLPGRPRSGTLEAIAAQLRTIADPVTASELADRLDMSRVTARRCLEHRHDLRLVQRAPRSGTPGDPN